MSDNQFFFYESPFLPNYDEGIVLYLSAIYHPDLGYLMKLVSEYGREYFWSVVTLTFFIFGGKQGKLTAIILIISLLIVIPINIIIKDLTDRDRPHTSVLKFTLEEQTDQSFPSGHSSVIAAGITSFVLIFYHTKRYLIVLSALMFEGLLVFFSRIYLGVHYPTDIIGGILLGTSITFVVSAFQGVYSSIIYRVEKKFIKQEDM